MAEEQKLTKEQKKFQVDMAKKVLAELEVKKKEKTIELERHKRFIEIGVPMREMDDFLEKLEKEKEKDISDLEKDKLEIEIQLAKKQKELDLPTLNANLRISSINRDLERINKEIEGSLGLIKKFRN